MDSKRKAFTERMRCKDYKGALLLVEDLVKEEKDNLLYRYYQVMCTFLVDDGEDEKKLLLPEAERKNVISFLLRSKKNDEHDRFIYTQAFWLHEAGEHEAAASIIETVDPRNEKNTGFYLQVRLLKARLYYFTGNLLEIVPCLHTFSSDHPENLAVYHILLGIAYAYGSESQEAKAHFSCVDFYKLSTFEKNTCLKQEGAILYVSLLVELGDYNEAMFLIDALESIAHQIRSVSMKMELLHFKVCIQYNEKLFRSCVVNCNNFLIEYAKMDDKLCHMELLASVQMYKAFSELSIGSKMSAFIQPKLEDPLEQKNNLYAKLWAEYIQAYKSGDKQKLCLFKKAMQDMEDRAAAREKQGFTHVAEVWLKNFSSDEQGSPEACAVTICPN